MNAKIINNQKRTLEALIKYQKSIFKEFLPLAKSLSKQMDILCEKGIDTKLHLRFEDVEVDETKEILYTVVDRKGIVRLKEILESMNEENAMKLYEENFLPNTIVNIWAYEEVIKMQELIAAKNDVQRAIVFVEEVKWQK